MIRGLIRGLDSARSAVDLYGMKKNPNLECDVLIIGGGLVGLTLGHALAGAGLSAVVLDRADPAKMQDNTFDGRASAIARGTKQMLQVLDLWGAMAPAAAPILDIRVSDARVGEQPSPLFLHYDHREVGDQPLGYIVENRAIRRGLFGALPREGMTLLAPCTLESLERGAHAVEATLGDGRRVTARLAVSAEGRNARLRDEARIEVTRWDYPQSGIVCTVEHSLPHEGVAHENFLPSGPFAMLPLTDDAEGNHRSSIVWTEKRSLVDHLMALPEADFSKEIARRFGDSLGTLKAVGPRWSYPLSLLLADRYIDNRLALVGDAAHGIHPIAGQGLNLGLRDVAALSEVLVDAARLGLDVGAATVLERYPQWRHFDGLALVAVTDALNRLFSNDIAPVRLARDLGLAAVQRIPPLKRLFMRHAMGLEGDLPRLIKGQPL
ncbi:2-octaprenyl-6-methoxyphenol hydroxylase [Limibacillus sp. MBR-115]